MLQTNETLQRSAVGNSSRDFADTGFASLQLDARCRTWPPPDLCQFCLARAFGVSFNFESIRGVDIKLCLSEAYSCRVGWLEMSRGAAGAFSTWLGPSLPRLYGKAPPPPPGLLPTSGPPGARPAMPVRSHSLDATTLSSLCKGRPGTEQPVTAYQRPSCPGAHHHHCLPPPISRWAVSLRIPPHPVGMAWAQGRPTELPG